MKVWDSLDCSDLGMVEFKILRGGRRTKSRIITLGFRRTNFGLFRDLLRRIPWEAALERREVQEI